MILQAAEIKNLIPVVWKIAGTLLSEEDPYERLILGALAGSAAMEEVIDNSKSSWALAPGEALAFSKACQTLNMSLSQLRLLTHDTKVALWNFTIKNHVLEHISSEAAEVSPRLTWNYGAESLLMHVRRLVQGNRSQPTMFALQAVVLRKWLGGLELSLNPRRL